MIDALLRIIALTRKELLEEAMRRRHTAGRNRALKIERVKRPVFGPLEKGDIVAAAADILIGGTLPDSEAEKRLGTKAAKEALGVHEQTGHGPGRDETAALLAELEGADRTARPE